MRRKRKQTGRRRERCKVKAPEGELPDAAQRAADLLNSLRGWRVQNPGYDYARHARCYAPRWEKGRRALRD